MISPNRIVNDDRASTLSIPAARAALMTSLCRCEAKPIVGIVARAGSFFISASVDSGSVRAPLRSKITSDGTLFRISAIASADDRAKRTAVPICVAALLIFDVNKRSSRTAKITSP